MIVESEFLQLSWIFELIKKSSLRRYCSGDDNDDVLGINVIIGEKQPREKV